MARTVFISVTLSLLVAAAGCTSPDSAYREPKRTVYESTVAANSVTDVNKSTDQVALVEQVIKNRMGYRKSLQLLVDLYNREGDNRRLGWAQQELRALDRMPQYTYIIDQSVFPEDLKATARIPEADKLFLDAYKTDTQARALGLLNEEQLRVALSKYKDVIRQYPTSDKIDDCAWQLAKIYEDFREFDSAIMFYKRTFQWDPMSTNYPARFNAAQLLDDMGRRDEALPLYQQSVDKEAKFLGNVSIAKRRIAELTNTMAPTTK
jgi:tetratricopeptide (TPR) repeat protein